MEKKRTETEKEQFFSNILFVSDLPKETKCKDLENLFNKYHFLKASLNNSKNNNIYAQVILENESYADKARHELNGFFLIPETTNNDKSMGKPIRICKYESKLNISNTNVDFNRNLLIKDIDDNMSQKEFYNIFLKYGDISSAKIEYDENGKSKGYGYIYYYDVSSAEKAKLELNGKKFYEKKLEIVNCIPNINKKNVNNLTLFLINLPSNITKKEIKSIFDKYGDIINIKLTDKGYAYITFSEYESALKCIKDIKKNPILFSGLPEVVVKFAKTKEERSSYKQLNNNLKSFENYEDSCKIFFKLIKDDKDEIYNEIELEKNIRLFIKIIFVTEYIPKSVEINYNIKSGIVIFNNKKDFNVFLDKYKKYCIKNIKPMFLCIPYNQVKTKYNLNFINLNNYNYNNSSNSLNIEQINKNNLLNNNYNFDKNNNIFKINKNDIINKNLSNIALNGSITNDNNLFSKDYQINDLSNRQTPSYNQFELIQNKNNFLNLNNMNNFFTNNNMILSNINNPINNLNNNYINGNINIRQLKYNNRYINNYQINPNQNNNLFKNTLNNKNYMNNNKQLNYYSIKDFSNLDKNNKDNYEEIIIYLCDKIYNIVNKKYPDQAEKITGMIKDLGPKEIISLLLKPDILNETIEKAYKMIIEEKAKNG